MNFITWAWLMFTILTIPVMIWSSIKVIREELQRQRDCEKDTEP